MPDLMNGLCGYGVMPPPMGSMPLQVTQPSNAPLPMAGSNDPELAALPVPKALPEKDPSKCFADELPRCVKSCLNFASLHERHCMRGWQHNYILMILYCIS